MIMDLQADLNWIHKELDEVKDIDLIKSIKMILKNRKIASSERIDIKRYNIEIEEAINQVEEGAILSHEKVGENIKQWSKK